MKKRKPKKKDDGMVCYTVSVSYRVRTMPQAKELQKALHAMYKSKVEVWCNTKLPKKWGIVTDQTTGKQARF